MRTVTFNISKLGLNVGDEIEIRLVNSIGKVFLSNIGYSVSESIILDSEIFSIELMESELLSNGLIKTKSTYQMIIPNGLKFNFEVPHDEENTPHDLLSLISLPCYRGIIDESTKQIDSEFIKKLDLLFMGNDPHFSNTQKSIFDMYVYYADEVKYEEMTIDIMQMMDEYISTIGIENE